MRIAAWATILAATAPRVQALQVPITVQRLAPAGVAARPWRAEPVAAGVPLALEDSITDITQLGLAGAGAAQFRVLQRDAATGRIRWVLVDFLSDAPGEEPLLVDGHGNFGGPDLATDAGDSIEIATGVATFAIRKHGFHLIDRARIGATEIVAPHTDGGIVVLADGTRYESARDTTAELRLEENGPVKAVVLARGTLHSAAGKASLAYTARLHFYKGSSACRAFVTLRDASIASLAARTFDAAWVELPVALGSNPRVTFGIRSGGRARGALSAPLPPGSTASLFQGDNAFQRSKRTEAILPNLTPARGLEVVLPQGAGGVDATGIAAGWMRLEDDSHAVLAGMRDLATLFPSGFDVRDGRLAVEMFSRHNPKKDLVFAWGAHETRELLFDFVATGGGQAGARAQASAVDTPAGAGTGAREAPAGAGAASGNAPSAGTAEVDRAGASDRSEDFLYQLQYPLLGRCDFSRYRDTGGIFGEHRLVSVAQERGFFAALGKHWKLEPVAESALTLERQYGFHTTGGPNQFDQDLGQLLDYLRTGDAGRFLEGRLGVTWKSDQAVLHSDDFDFGEHQNGVSDVRVAEVPGFNGRGAGNLFDDEHPHWTCMPLYYELTGDERVREAIDDYGEWRLYRAGNPRYGAIHGGGIKSLRLWSRCLRDMALLYEFTGKPLYLDYLGSMSKTLTTTIERNGSVGRNLERGYFYFGEPKDPARPIHLFFLTEMNSLAVLDAIRVLPDGDPEKEELRDYLCGLAWFTLQEAQISPNAPGYPYRYDSAVPNLELGKRGDQTGPLLVHGYEMSGDDSFLKQARAYAWHVLEYQSQARGSEIPTHITIYTWLHRGDAGAELLTPEVRPNPDSTFTLTWTAPDAAREYIVKYGPRPLVENLGFDQKTRGWAVDPTSAMNFWAATNVAGEPVPGPAGTLETFTTPRLPAGEWHFAVKVLTGSGIWRDAADSPASGSDDNPALAVPTNAHPHPGPAVTPPAAHVRDPHHEYRRPRPLRNRREVH